MSIKSSGSIKSVADLLRIASISEKKYGEPWYRGQISKNLPLKPGVYRKPPLRNRAYDEQSLTNDFVDKALPRHPNCPDPEQYAQWLFLMQHYGLPTRLLDWSASPAIALFFAIWPEPDYTEKEKPGEFFILDPGGLNKCQINRDYLLGWWEDQAFRLFADAWGRSDIRCVNKIAAISATEWDSRMMVQQTCFTIHGIKTPIENLKNSNRFLLSYIIPPEAKPKLRDELLLLGFWAYTLFPDLEHLSEELKEFDY